MAQRLTTYGHWNDTIDEVNLRCFAIIHLGDLPGDLDELLYTVTTAIALEPNEARALAAHWRELPRSRSAYFAATRTYWRQSRS